MQLSCQNLRADRTTTRRISLMDLSLGKYNSADNKSMESKLTMHSNLSIHFLKQFYSTVQTFLKFIYQKNRHQKYILTFPLVIVDSQSELLYFLIHLKEIQKDLALFLDLVLMLCVNYHKRRKMDR